MSAFFGLYIARSGMMAHQRAMEVTGHNIANANTPGFSRQQAIMQAGTPFPYPSANAPAGAPGQLGTGVQVAMIRRVRDSFLDHQLRNEYGTLNYWDARRDVLSQIETIFMEPSEFGLSNLLNEFWDAWHEMSKNPESLPVRISLREKAQALTDTVQLMYNNLGSLKEGIALDISSRVSEINSMAVQIRDLNEQIVKVTALGQQPNDLADQRDLILDKLSQYIDITVSHTPSGTVSVFTNSRPLVQDSQIFALKAIVNTNNAEVVWERNDYAVTLRSGELNALLKAYNDFIPSYQGNLDTLVTALVEKVNEVHQGGVNLNDLINEVDPAIFSSYNFFAPIDPTEFPASLFFRLSEEVAADVNNIAAASFDPGNPEEIGPADGSNALNIARLRTNLTMHGNSTTFEGYYQNIIARLGVEGEEAGRIQNLQNQIVSALEYRKEQASGVSLDEEMINLVQFQYSYQAAAKLVATMDEMLDVLINRTGR
ncbi:MAG: flagellar hook-associated protein FlgK [Clostridiales bacterium]|jgi:flagellar hook-associated protein 1 FlgK|nr:flagellar hook-associated protein FlgK [Clostridiales bacterium]